MKTLASLTHNNFLYSTIGVVLAVVLMFGLRSCSSSRLAARRNEARPTQVATHHERLDQVLDTQLSWADQQSQIGLAQRMQPVRQFFLEAKQGSRAFAEDMLGFESKTTLAADFVRQSPKHPAFVQVRFNERVFNPDQLEQLIDSTVTTYLAFLGDVDSELLVRLEADLAELSKEDLPLTIDQKAIEAKLTKALQRATQAVQVDMRAMVGREVVSFVAGEVLSTVATQLATSAGILAAGGGSSTVTLGVGLAVGIAADYAISKAYEAAFDPAGQIAAHVNRALNEIEALIVSGDQTQPGLERRLLDYAARRGRARAESIKAALSP